MSGVEFVLAFLAGVVMGGALDRFVLPLLVDAWIDRLRRHGETFIKKMTLPIAALSSGHPPMSAVLPHECPQGGALAVVNVPRRREIGRVLGGGDRGGAERQRQGRRRGDQESSRSLLSLRTSTCHPSTRRTGPRWR